MRLSELQRSVRGVGRAQFVASTKAPLLVPVEGELEIDAGGFATANFQVRRDVNAETSDDVFSEKPKDPEVHVVQKTDRNPFGHMITVGRSPNNDIIIEHTNVSKVHAYFTCVGGVWKLHDQPSKNGTFIRNRDEDVRVSASGQEIKCGTSVRFGKRLTFRFFLPGGFYDAST